MHEGGSGNKALLMTGGTGFIGRHLCRHLSVHGYNITVLTRDPEQWRQVQPNYAVNYTDDLSTLDTKANWYGVINLAGEPLGGGRWNPYRKMMIRESRVSVTSRLYRWMQTLDTMPEVFLSGSAVGWYGHSGDEILDESSTGEDGFSHQLCSAWEAAAIEPPLPRCRTCLVRIGLVLGVDGGPLKQMLVPSGLGLGGPFGGGRQWWSWIHIHDLLRLYQFLLENEEISGPVNATSPNPVRQKVFAKAVGKQFSRPAFIPMPAFIARWIFGEFADEILLHGQRVLPVKATEAGFNFHYPELDSTLRDLLA